MMSWSLQKKKRALFVTVLLSGGIFFNILYFISMCSVLNKLSEYTYLYMSKKHYFVHFCSLFLKSWKAFGVSFKAGMEIAKRGLALLEIVVFGLGWKSWHRKRFSNYFKVTYFENINVGIQFNGKQYCQKHVHFGGK